MHIHILSRVKSTSYSSCLILQDQLMTIQLALLFNTIILFASNCT
uniref:Uncharacterized protein n=1 Tax=Arundo donax TaxID=35708 RepID=A0A0A8YUW7_ARUDO